MLTHLFVSATTALVRSGTSIFALSLWMGCSLPTTPREMKHRVEHDPAPHANAPAGAQPTPEPDAMDWPEPPPEPGALLPGAAAERDATETASRHWETVVLHRRVLEALHRSFTTTFAVTDTSNIDDAIEEVAHHDFRRRHAFTGVQNAGNDLRRANEAAPPSLLALGVYGADCIEELARVSRILRSMEEDVERSRVQELYDTARDEISRYQGAIDATTLVVMERIRRSGTPVDRHRYLHCATSFLLAARRFEDTTQRDVAAAVRDLSSAHRAAMHCLERLPYRDGDSFLAQVPRIMEAARLLAAALDAADEETARRQRRTLHTAFEAALGLI